MSQKKVDKKLGHAPIREQIALLDWDVPRFVSASKAGEKNVAYQSCAAGEAIQFSTKAA